MGLSSFASGRIQDFICNLCCGSIYPLCFQNTSANCCPLRAGVASAPLWLGRDHVSTKNQPQRFRGGIRAGVRSGMQRLGRPGAGMQGAGLKKC